MKRYGLFYLFLLLTCYLGAQEQEELTPKVNRLAYQVIEGDTVFLAFLREVHVFPPMKFQNRRQEQFYWRTVRDVKRTLPFAKIVGRELREVNALLENMPRASDRRRFLANYERDIFKKFEPELRKLTINQGRMLLKLIDRECNTTSFELIRSYRGSVSAIFWQGIARLFGSNLKTEFDATTGNDKIIERVIVLVESGQL